MSKKRSKRSREIRKFRRSARPATARDPKDQFGPSATLCRVYCLHCDAIYWSDQIKWDSRAQLWVCMHWPLCSGAGFGVNLREITEEDALWLYA